VAYAAIPYTITQNTPCRDSCQIGSLLIIVYNVKAAQKYKPAEMDKI